MMIVQMDKISTPLRERAQHLYEKTVELENKHRKAVEARIPFDPNSWQQIRENYEAIILEDHTFSEQHNIEYALWQLHYKRIEEFRAHYNAALASCSSNAAQNAKDPSRPERIAKHKLQFRTFLSEATGFYHDLILKIRSKYGLPLGYFSEDSEIQNVADRDGKKSTEVRKGLVSCHRCLIYLGDLARYKGLYGEGDTKNREYAAASSYYLQAASLWPPGGNPHHQLAILASYSGDELVAVYRYFRSLAVESPFPTARDNLIVAYEKNRQSYSQLLAGIKDSSSRPTGKGRGKVERGIASKDVKLVASPEKDEISSANEMHRTFCTRFVRLNGILFTRTSLEIFSEVLALVSSGLQELLSSGPEEVLNFGTNAGENALFIVRLVSILIFIVHNSKKETEGQTYAEIVQHAVLVQNSFTATFELIGQIIDRGVQLRDLSSSYLLPGILVFIEWLACCPDVAAGSEVDDKQAAVRSNFWNRCISFFNKILSLGAMFVDDDEDETCFSKMSKYDERETENRLALWEDLELRGFLPLLPAQTTLDFSRKHSFGSEGVKEKNARMKRILAAAKALASVIRIDKNTVYFDSRAKKFMIGVESSDVLFTSDTSPPETKQVMLGKQANGAVNSTIMEQNQQPYLDEEDEDEIIVFKPIATEKKIEALDPKYVLDGGLGKPDQSASLGDLQSLGGLLSASHNNLHPQASVYTSFQVPASVGSNLHLHLQPAQLHASKWLPEVNSLAGSLTAFNLMGNGHVAKNEVQGNHGISYFPAHSLPIYQSFDVNGIGGMPHPPSRAPEPVMMPNAMSSSVATADSFRVHTSSAMSARKSPISRPVRHLGPPPGFNPVPSKQSKETISGSDLISNNPLADDYSWLDGYQPKSTRGFGLDDYVNYASHAKTEYMGTSSALNGSDNFPFYGKQNPLAQVQGDLHKSWQNYQQMQQQQLVNENQQSAVVPEQYLGQSVWPGHYFV